MLNGFPSFPALLVSSFVHATAGKQRLIFWYCSFSQWTWRLAFKETKWIITVCQEPIKLLAFVLVTSGKSPIIASMLSFLCFPPVVICVPSSPHSYMKAVLILHSHSSWYSEGFSPHFALKETINVHFICVSALRFWDVWQRGQWQKNTCLLETEKQLRISSELKAVQLDGG